MLKEQLIANAIALGKAHKEVATNDDTIEYYDFIQSKLQRGVGLGEAKQEYNKRLISTSIEKLKERQR